jgi:PST family polysaccharide transporter
MLPAGRALMPAYARLANDPRELATSLQIVLSFAAIIACATGVGMSCIADDAVFVVLGDQWSDAVPFVRWLGIFGALEGLWLMFDPFLIATRHERTLAISNLAFSALTIPVVAAVALLVGVEAIPLARIAVMAAVLGGVLARMLSWKWISAAALTMALWRPLAAALAMAGAVHLLHLDGSSSRLVSMAADMVSGGMTYLGVLFALWALSGRPDGAERILAGLVARLFTTRSAPT